MRVVLDVVKSSIFVVQKMALHQNGVEFCQQSISDIRSSVATLYDVVRRYQSFQSTYVLTKSCMEAGTLPKKDGVHCKVTKGEFLKTDTENKFVYMYSRNPILPPKNFTFSDFSDFLTII